MSTTRAFFRRIPESWIPFIGPLASQFPFLAGAAEDYGEWNTNLSDGERLEQRWKGQLDWSNSGLARRQRQALADWLARNHLLDNELTDTTTIIDLGAGDGRSLESLRFLLDRGKLLERIILVDRSPKALARARQKFANTRFRIETREMDMRDPAAWSTSQSRTTLAFAASSLHELSSDGKRQLLSLAAATGSTLVLLELLSDHDSEPTGSIRLIERSAWFYDALISDAYRSVPPGSRRRAVVGAFLLDEVLALWEQPYERRGNYHLDLDGWCTALQASGFYIESFQETKLLDNGPATGFIKATSRNAEFNPPPDVESLPRKSP